MVALFVNEIFGPTIQGEGPAIGEPAAFLRVAGCNLACSWCDTAYTWDWKRYDKTAEVHRYDPGDAVDVLRQHLPPTRPPLVVLSGGEPMLQQPALAETLGELALYSSFVVDVETAGTIEPKEIDPYVRRYVVSPKLEHSGNPKDRRYRPDALIALRDTGRMVLKFVVRYLEDFQEVDSIVDDLAIPPESVYIMPEGIDSAMLNHRAKVLTPAAIERGYRMTTRLHVSTWGNRRGV